MMTPKIVRNTGIMYVWKAALDLRYICKNCVNCTLNRNLSLLVVKFLVLTRSKIYDCN